MTSPVQGCGTSLEVGPELTRSSVPAFPRSATSCGDESRLMRSLWGRRASPTKTQTARLLGDDRGVPSSLQGRRREGAAMNSQRTTRDPIWMFLLRFFQAPTMRRSHQASKHPYCPLRLRCRGRRVGLLDLTSSDRRRLTSTAFPRSKRRRVRSGLAKTPMSRTRILGRAATQMAPRRPANASAPHSRFHPSWPRVLTSSLQQLSEIAIGLSQTAVHRLSSQFSRDGRWQGSEL